MPKNILTRLDRNLARRLREARREVGKSTRAVADCLPPRIRVSHATIASYENGVTVPTIDVLAALAKVYERTVEWFLDDRELLTDFKYFNLPPRVPLSEQRKYSALANKWTEAYIAVERHLKAKRKQFSLDADQLKLPINIVDYVRKSLLNLSDSQPVDDTVSVLESFSAWVVELRADFSVEGASARHGAKTVVVINPDAANERTRLNIAQELAHLLFNEFDLVAGNGPDEAKAFVFASTFLMPDSQLSEAFSGRSFIKLLKYKERFGISLAAMIHRAETLKIINTTASRWLWSEMSRRGWKQKEPGMVRRDRAVNFETLLESAVQTKKLSWAEAVRVTGISELELKKRLDDVTVDVSDESSSSEILRIVDHWIA